MMLLFFNNRLFLDILLMFCCKANRVTSYLCEGIYQSPIQVLLLVFYFGLHDDPKVGRHQRSWRQKSKLHQINFRFAKFLNTGCPPFYQSKTIYRRFNIYKLFGPKLPRTIRVKLWVYVFGSLLICFSSNSTISAISK